VECFFSSHFEDEVDNSPGPLEHPGSMRKLRPLLLVAIGSAVALSYGYYSCQKRERDDESRTAALAVQPFKLPNGLEVELVAGACGDDVALTVLFEIGANHDPAGQSGMAELVARTLSASAPERAKRTVESGSDYILYSVVAAGDQLLGEIDAAAASMMRLQVGAVELRAARAQVLEELAKRSGGDAPLTAMTYAAESLQPSRGNGRRGGVADEVEAIDPPAVDSFWRAHFKPSNARVVVLGRIDATKVRAHVEQAFGQIPAGKAPALRPPTESTVIGNLVMGDAPTAVALAVPAPEPSDPVYPAFLVLAARLIGAAPGSLDGAASYDPLARPETLFVTGVVQPGEGAEPAAVRLRSEATKLLAPALTPADVAAARERFGLFLGLHELDPKSCAADPRGIAVARARRAQLDLGKLNLGEALDKTTQQQLDEAAALFAPKRTTAVIAGGTIH
jgi:zinc protease